MRLFSVDQKISLIAETLRRILRDFLAFMRPKHGLTVGVEISFRSKLTNCFSEVLTTKLTVQNAFNFLDISLRL